MSEPLEVIRGTGNVFRDTGIPNPDVEQTKAILAAEIVRILDEEALSVRAAQKRTGVAYADFSRIWNADLDRFTIDRLMIVLGRLGRAIEIRVRTRELESVETT